MSALCSIIALLYMFNIINFICLNTFTYDSSHHLLQLTAEQLQQSIWELSALPKCCIVVYTSSCHGLIFLYNKSQKLSTPKIGSVSILLLRWVFLKCVCTWPATFHPLLSLTDQRELRGDGRDHYITKHPVAIVLSNCHTTLLQHSPQTSGQVVCAIAQTQEGKDNRERKKAGNNEIMRKRNEGKKGELGESLEKG